MTPQPTITELTTQSFYEQLEACLKQHPPSAEGLLFEKRIEREAFNKLAAMGRMGWDFETASLFFGDRGISILILNVELEWQIILAWLCELHGTMPPKTIINFEVHDSIQGSMMTGGNVVGRWVFTSSNSFMCR